uniref:Deoxyribodipyrimidine photo-lyase n=1 Tax=Glossina palpalis gambiensis TaxID=67801 RepID=A0A1B0BVE5_9MUSC
MKRSKQSAKISKKIKFSNRQEFDEDHNNSLVESFRQKRLCCSDSVIDFAYKKKRVRILTENQREVREDCEGPVVYWMYRDQRVQDNWAFLYAQRLALKLELPLCVCFCLLPKYIHTTLRHYKFMLTGLEEVAQECEDLNVNFHLLNGPAHQSLVEFLKEVDAATVVCDFSPLRLPLQWLEEIKEVLPTTIPFIQIDAHNVVPVWIASQKQEYAARTIRNKINSQLEEYLTEFPPLIKHKYLNKKPSTKVNWRSIYNTLKCLKTVDEVSGVMPGYKNACRKLLEFCQKRLKLFHEKRNDPNIDALSGLSPWFNFGQISIQRCILEIKTYEHKFKDSVVAFCEEAIVRRELADNFCFYNQNYDNFEGLQDWSRKTLNEHRKDVRSPCYSLEEFEQARTHDDLWNSAQLQLMREGKMHGFLRMYWAKKILEWSKSPEDALEFSLLLNDRYSLDGTDPNGYVGCMWSIGGIHDQGWAERKIFGKIRYMNYQGCKRKFDVAAFVARYGGVAHIKT